MDIKIIKNKKHYLFDSLIEYRKLYKEKVLSNWRDGEEGCWIYTDDFYICQVLKKSELILKVSCISDHEVSLIKSKL